MNKYTSLALFFLVLFFKQGFTQVGELQFIDDTFDSSGVSMLISADLDNDGDDELIASISSASGSIIYFENFSPGFFSGINVIDSIPFLNALATGDFNNDSWLDIVTIGGINNEAFLFYNTEGSFGEPIIIDSGISVFMNDLVVADFDTDLDDDIVIIGQHSIDLYRNDSEGDFIKENILTTSTAPGVLECLDLAKADMDNDGDLDLICGETAGLVVYENSGNAIFEPNYYSIIPEVGWVIHPFEIDDDEFTDVLMINGAGDVKWFRNNGDASLTLIEILPNIPDLLAMTSIDYNNDGLMDLYASYTHNVSVFLNDENHTFNTEINIHEDNSLIMGPVHIMNIDNVGKLDYIWAGVTKSIAFHLSDLNTQSLTSTRNDKDMFYPNPTTGILNISTHLSIDIVGVYTNTGQLIDPIIIDNQIDITNYPDGIYYVHANSRTSGKSMTQYVIKTD